jgi:hypothetical protein
VGDSLGQQPCGTPDQDPGKKARWPLNDLLNGAARCLDTFYSIHTNLTVRTHNLHENESKCHKDVPYSSHYTLEGRNRHNNERIRDKQPQGEQGVPGR